MAPLIDETDYLVDVDDYDFFSEIDSKDNSSAPLHVTSIQPKHRRVSFSTNVTSHYVMSRDEYTAEEMKATWHDHPALRQMKNCARSDARLFESGVLAEGDDVSFRGLEARTTIGLRQKRQNRMNAYAAVFFEIDTQHDMGMTDDDAIADAYFNYSEPCLMAAQMIAVRDAEEAKNAMHSMKTDARFGASLLLNLAMPANLTTTPMSAAA
ncbi:hypothetical protein IV203_003795 [Nitzschia inconspicua]|uniref:Uncharacterized protein n=1 Tax=Nitzschia inconspicua TaxID=303405 RepID=A0A9K3L2K9_9STRA|nr:hypothetical protein IV203_003795 [Nitzschia inconspicua]